jgi:uncharacterized protein involved in exopolysaccharide biosynthesis/Mrp family chromosome partitioning ATPase
VSSQSEGLLAPASDIDLGVLGRALWRKKYLIFGLTLLTAAIAFAVVNLITPRYKSEARVLIEARENIFFRPDAEKTADRATTVDQEAVTSQVQLILSRDLAREVIKKLNLAERAEFDPVLGGLGRLTGLISLIGLAKNPLDMTPEERVLKSYYDRLSAFQVEKSRVIAIEFESQDPDLAAQVANAVAETYLVFQQTARQEQTRAASAWLAGEIDRLRGSVAQAEARVEQYRAKTNLFVGNNNTTLSNQQLGDFTAQFASARAQKADAEAKAKLIRDALKAGTPIEFSDITNSELMRRLSEQRVTLRAQLAEQSSTLLDQHPRIKELRAQIADLERQMRGEADRLARSLENDAKLASSKVDELAHTLDQLKHQAASTNEQDVQLRALERDAKSQRDLLESYLAKYREATARDSIGAAASDARIISTAAVSTTPAWPKKLPIVLVAALGMFVLCCGTIASSALLSAAAFEQAPAYLGTAALPTRAAPGRTKRSAGAVGSTAEIGADSSPLTREGPQTGVIEQLAREFAEGQGPRRTAVISERANAGATSVAIGLARALATQSRVALVDLALASPNLSAIASDPSAPGLAELVEETASFGDIITRDRHSQVHLVMAGHAKLDAAAIMGSQRLAIAIEAIGRSYDQVVIDCGRLEEAWLGRWARFALRAVFVTSDPNSSAAALAREDLLKAGFVEVILVSERAAPVALPEGSKAAAAA